MNDGKAAKMSNGKGSAPRPIDDRTEFDKRWDQVFGDAEKRRKKRKKNKEKED